MQKYEISDLCGLQGFKSHELLSQAEEVELSKRVQDFLLCERTLTDMEVELGYKPDFASWADRLGEKENSLRDRLELGLAVCPSLLISHNHHGIL